MAPTCLTRLSLVGLLLLTAPAQAGWWGEGGRDIAQRASLQVTGAVRGYKLTSTHGRTVVVTLPRPADLAAPLTLPAGPWAELTLLLDGPVTVVSGTGSVKLELDTLVVPLSDPDAREVHLEWSLPEAPLGQLDAADLFTALVDGAVAAP